MKEKDLKNRLKGIGEWTLKGRNRVKIFFLLLAVVLWFLIKLSKPGYVAQVELPIAYQNLPNDKLMTEDPAHYLKLRLQADGYTLMRYSLWNKKALKVDLRRVKHLKNNRYYWESDQNIAKLEAQFGNARILGLTPDTLFLNLSDLVRKRVPVVAQVKTAPESEMYIYQDPLIKPDSLWITGPPTAVNQVDSLYTVPFALPADPGDSLHIELSLADPGIEHLTFPQRKVKVDLQMSRMTEELVEVPIQAIHVPDSLALELYPNRVSVKYRVALRDFHRVQEGEFIVIADYRSITQQPEQRFISLRLEELPDVIKQARLEPKRVEFIVTAQ